MKPKYWVPALDRANQVIDLIAQNPNKFRLIDISKKLDINKSSMYSLLNTLETLQWIKKNDNEYYSLGHVLGSYSAAYFSQFDIVDLFSSEAKKSISVVDEHVQLGTLKGGEVYYLAREEGSSPAKLVTDPGMHFPAYAAAIGKIQLSQHSYEHLKKLYPEEKLYQKTKFSVSSVDELWEQIAEGRANGYVTEEQEGAIGFCCVAAPVYDEKGRITAGVSFTMLERMWEEKKELAKKEIVRLGNALSKRTFT